MDEIIRLSEMEPNEFYNEIIREYINRRMLIFNDEVSKDVVEDYILYIMKWNREDKGLPYDKRKSIIIYMNSLGGDVFSASGLIDVMLASETPIITVCLGITASAGYHIFLAGDQRVAFKNSIFLQHDGTIEVANTSSKARDVMNFMETMEERTRRYVLDRTNLTEEFYDSIYDQEYYMYAQEAKELGIVTNIIGEDISLDEII